MQYTEIEQDLFDVDKVEYYFAHCISSDCQMDAGIAVHFNRNFKLRKELLKKTAEELSFPTCVKVEGSQVFNLITKERYWNIPSYESVRESLIKMKDQIEQENIKKLAMPRIASGLDQKDWKKIREMIKDVFKDTDIEIIVCYFGEKTSTDITPIA
ncbi:MAG: macro domain-containing protein [Promethearchaeota archaeon]